MDSETRQRIAQEFADEHGVEIENWMLWEGWSDQIGCAMCNEMGEYASCWGYAGCHGYYNGCVCQGCRDTDAREDEKWS